MDESLHTIAEGWQPLKSRRLNVVDLVIVLLVVFAVMFLAEKVAPKGSSTTTSKPMQAVFISNTLPVWKPLMTDLTPGSQVQAVLGGTTYPFGTLVQATVKPAYVSAPNAQGQWVAGSDPLQRRIQLTVKINAVQTKTGYTVNSNPVYIGQLIVMTAGPVQLTGYLETVQK